jgi:hypothetical protein
MRYAPLPPTPRPTAGFAQPTGFGSAEQCSAKPCLRPHGKGVTVVRGLRPLPVIVSLPPWGGSAVAA